METLKEQYYMYKTYRVLMTYVFIAVTDVFFFNEHSRSNGGNDNSFNI